MKSKGLTTESNLKQNVTKKKAVFKPTDPLDIRDRDERYAYRWLNVNKLEKNGGHTANGWEVEKTLTGSGEANAPTGLRNSAHSLDGTVRIGDLVRARMPIEMAEARTEYYENKRKKKDEIMHARKSIHDGNVEFESRRGQRIEKY